MTEPGSPHRPLEPSDRNSLADLFRDSLDPGYGEAARRRGDAGRPPGRMRAVTLVALVAVGLLLAVAYQQVVAEEPTRSQVREDLEEQIEARQAEAEQLRQQADQLREEVVQLRDQQLSDPQVARQLRELEATTGLGRVHGDGVVVQVADGPPGVDPKTGEAVLDPDARIKDIDLQLIANALWAAGAEAVAINDRRLTSTSSIRRASEAILVNRQPIAGPYRVAAIGPPDLRERFHASLAAAVMRQLGADYGVGYELSRTDDLALPAASEPQLRHATSGGSD